MKLLKLLSLKNRNNDIFTLVNKLRQYILLNKFKKPFISLARNQFFTKIKDNERKDNILDLLRNIFPKINENNNEIILRQYLSKWLNKMKAREIKLNQSMNTLKKSKLKLDINNLINVFLIKKLMHDVPYARAKSFFDKIREVYDKKNKNEKLSDALKKTNDDIK